MFQVDEVPEHVLRRKSASRAAESGIGLLSLGDEREDLVAIVEEVAQRVGFSALP